MNMQLIDVGRLPIENILHLCNDAVDFVHLCRVNRAWHAHMLAIGNPFMCATTRLSLLRTAFDVQVNTNHVFVQACAHGQLSTAQFLRDKFCLPLPLVRRPIERRNIGFRILVDSFMAACWNGRLHAAQWLHQQGGGDSQWFEHVSSNCVAPLSRTYFPWHTRYIVAGDNQREWDEVSMPQLVRLRGVNPQLETWLRRTFSLAGDSTSSGSGQLSVGAWTATLFEHGFSQPRGVNPCDLKPMLLSVDRMRGPDLPCLWQAVCFSSPLDVCVAFYDVCADFGIDFRLGEHVIAFLRAVANNNLPVVRWWTSQHQLRDKLLQYGLETREDIITWLQLAGASFDCIDVVCNLCNCQMTPFQRCVAAVIYACNRVDACNLNRHGEVETHCSPLKSILPEAISTAAYRDTPMIFLLLIGIACQRDNAAVAHWLSCQTETLFSCSRRTFALSKVRCDNAWFMWHSVCGNSHVQRYFNTTHSSAIELLQMDAAACYRTLDWLDNFLPLPRASEKREQLLQDIIAGSHNSPERAAVILQWLDSRLQWPLLDAGLGLASAASARVSAGLCSELRQRVIRGYSASDFKPHTLRRRSL